MIREVDVDAQAIDLFADQLRAFTVRVDDSTSVLDRELSRLSVGWDDSAFRRFYESVGILETRMIEFVAKNEAFAQYLAGKADEVREIHQRDRI